MICLSLLGDNLDQQSAADIVELYFDKLDPQALFSLKTKPWIHKSQGDPTTLAQVLAFGIEYVDLDLHSDLIPTVKKPTKLILSYHNFQKTPPTAELHKIAKEMRAKGADIIKIATHAQSFQDSLRMLEFLDQQQAPAICLCMGPEGRITRATGHLLGNYLMYAPISAAEQTAAGQIPLAELRQIHNLS